jgi:hypothetical protein
MYLQVFFVSTSSHLSSIKGNFATPSMNFQEMMETKISGLKQEWFNKSVLIWLL